VNKKFEAKQSRTKDEKREVREKGESG